MASNEYVETVANSIIRQLEKGTAPWIKPWKAGERFMPFNPTTGNDYHGMNAVWLMCVTEDRGYSDNRWLTYKQAGNLDAQVKRGEKGTQIQYWKWTEDVNAVDENGRPLTDDSGKALRQSVRLQKPRVWSATVFNASQILGLPEMEQQPVLPEWERHQQAEAILNDSLANINYQPSNRAFYSPSTDIITLPQRAQFTSMDSFYATALHELGHWTGHHNRLNRDLAHPFGSEGYAKEELRAEIASLMLGEQLGIGHDPEQHVAYIASWIKILQEDPREIFRATADAERITKYIHGREMLQEKIEEQKITEQVLMPVMASATDMALRTNPQQTYLEVPYVEKDSAEKLGAKWDPIEKSWYVPEGIALEPLKKWMGPKQPLHIELKQNPEVEFSEALRAAGLILNEMPKMDGNLYRVPVEGDSGAKKSGAYVGYLDGHPAGYIHNYKTGYEKTWKSTSRENTISTKEIVTLEVQNLDRKSAREKERDSVNKQTADAVAKLLADCESAQTHPYLKAKGVQAYGLKINTVGPIELTGSKTNEKPQQWSGKGQLLVPIQDIDGNLLGAQSIDNSGRKIFPRGGRMLGGHHVLGTIGSSNKMLIAEGYATAATLHEATGLPVVVAFNAGNLPTVAQAYREKYQEKTIILAGDNDHSKPIDKNVGRQKAEQAALIVGGHVLLPEFEPGASGSDWNDIAKLKGPDELKFELGVGLKNIERKVMAASLASNAEIQNQKTEKQLVNRPELEKGIVQSASVNSL